MKVARVYLRVSTEGQDLSRQESIVQEAEEAGFYIAAVYREKASGMILNRPELQRMINDLQNDEVVIAENIDRISRLPHGEAIDLINKIKEKGAKISIPGIIDLSTISNATDGISKIVLDSIQEMLLKITLQIAHDEYNLRRDRIKKGISKAKELGKFKGRKPNTKKNKQIVELRKLGSSISKTAQLTNSSISQVKLIWAKYKKEISNDR
ncbi:recombinase family protein (plasmid) [Acinetobacter sp. ESL0695]|uniref:recombinase family protein n=1 Tax=Acinetobacter sp. ESL0695 TaxID=2983215 RepID=UPI0023EFC948|nr:recombinase family protein [Acinetobacter sp. ESL0695]WEV50213.1 recombinase family protein [Acinetobacter sp. ESL0695]